MVNPVRLPLVENTEPRLSDSEKDGLTANLFFEKAQNGAVYATKRPGLTSNITGSGQAQGVFTYDGQVFNFNLPAIYWNDGIWAGGKFCFVSGSELFPSDYPGYYSITSADGLSWNYGTMAAVPWISVAYGASTYCAVSGGFNSLPGNFYVSNSTDGLTWTSRTSPAIKWTDLASSGTRIVGVGTTGTGVVQYSVYSDDGGTNWSNGNLTSSTWNKVAYCSGLTMWLAVRAAESASYATSTDGATWTNRTYNTSITSLVAASSSRFCVIDNDDAGKTSRISTDGINWTDTGVMPLGANSSNISWRDLEWTGTYFVAVGGVSSQNVYYDYVAYSTDGLSWTLVTNPGLTFQQTGDSFYLCIAGNTSVVVSSGAALVGSEYSYSSAIATFTLKNANVFNTTPDIN